MGFWIQSQLSHQPPVMLGEPMSSPACKIGLILLLVILTLVKIKKKKKRKKNVERAQRKIIINVDEIRFKKCFLLQMLKILVKRIVHGRILNSCLF